VLTTEALSEAEKLRRVPGISFMDEPTGRCANVEGTGLGVWEIIEIISAGVRTSRS